MIITVIIMLIIITPLLVLIGMAYNSPCGWEDENGSHLGEK